ncbi:L-rhamnose-binding lectin CSL3-like [Poecilia reticulata]|uniref:L-rhamnose-binding lectin CSL3-like n=1 Tax=Poecilia reticulata TaxID=8081 RepID=UPI0004A3076B|nr:PREDICTED: L-rhamnose-binding lectin CSL3-like [Poecilia reticulata]
MLHHKMKLILFTLFLCGFILEINAGRGLQKLKEPWQFPIKSLRVACEESVVQIECEENEIIFVINAKYGRSDQTTCSDGIPEDQTTNSACVSRADLVFQRCNGKSECSVLASSSVFGDPCAGTYKYLEVLYLCFKPF